MVQCDYVLQGKAWALADLMNLLNLMNKFNEFNEFQNSLNLLNSLNWAPGAGLGRPWEKGLLRLRSPKGGWVKWLKTPPKAPECYNATKLYRGRPGH